MSKRSKEIDATYMKKQSFILFFILSIITMNGQTEMLIGQISGRTIVRENFDKDGMLLNKRLKQEK